VVSFRVSLPLFRLSGAGCQRVSDYKHRAFQISVVFGASPEGTETPRRSFPSTEYTPSEANASFLKLYDFSDSLYSAPRLLLSMSATGQRLTKAVDQRAIVLAYRHLYRQGLKLVNYSAPARHVILRILRSSFRSASRDDFDPERISNTLHFLQRASEYRGLEHKIVKNLIMVRYWEQPQVKKDVRM